jgi:hypothetical protein
LDTDVRRSCRLYRTDAVGDEGRTAGRGDWERALVGCGRAGDTGDRGTEGAFATDFDVVESGVSDDRRCLSGAADDCAFIAADFLATRLPSFLAASLDLVGVP